jgi:hypothetical protein
MNTTNGEQDYLFPEDEVVINVIDLENCKHIASIKPLK